MARVHKRKELLWKEVTKIQQACLLDHWRRDHVKHQKWDHITQRDSSQNFPSCNFTRLNGTPIVLSPSSKVDIDNLLTVVDDRENTWIQHSFVSLREPFVSSATFAGHPKQ
jgi:hypothetical protein